MKPNIYIKMLAGVILSVLFILNVNAQDNAEQNQKSKEESTIIKVGDRKSVV